MAQQVMSSSEEDQPDIQYGVPDLQPPVTELTDAEEEATEAPRLAKIRNVHA